MRKFEYVRDNVDVPVCTDMLQLEKKKRNPLVWNKSIECNIVMKISSLSHIESYVLHIV